MKFLAQVLLLLGMFTPQLTADDFQDAVVQEMGLFSDHRGKRGRRGERGKRGYRGRIGKTGAQGDTGASGAKGDTGSSGKDGEPGAQGDTGASGEKGDTGPAGKDGETGPAGPTGPAGTAGDVDDVLASPTYLEDFVSGGDLHIASGYIGAFGWYYDGKSGFIGTMSEDDNHPGILQIYNSNDDGDPIANTLKLRRIPLFPTPNTVVAGRDFDLEVIFRCFMFGGAQSSGEGIFLGWSDLVGSSNYGNNGLLIKIDTSSPSSGGWPLSAISVKDAAPSEKSFGADFKIRNDKWYKLRMTKHDAGLVVFTITPEDPSDGNPVTVEVTDSIPVNPLSLFAKVTAPFSGQPNVGVDIDAFCWKFLNIQR